MSDYRGLRWVRDRQSLLRHTYEEFTPSSGWTKNPNFHLLLLQLPGFKRADVKLQIDKSGTIAISGERLEGERKHVHFEKAFTVPEDSDLEGIVMRFEGETLKVTIPRVAKEEKKEDQQGRVVDQEKKEGPKVTKEEKKEDQQGKIVDEKSEEPKVAKEEKKEDQQGEVVDEKKEEPKAAEEDKKEDQKEGMEHKEEEPERPNEGTEQHIDENEKEENRRQPEEEDIRNQGRENQDQGETSKKSVVVKIIENKGILIASIISFTLGVLLSQRFHPPSTT